MSVLRIIHIKFEKIKLYHSANGWYFLWQKNIDIEREREIWESENEKDTHSDMILLYHNFQSTFILLYEWCRAHPSLWECLTYKVCVYAVYWLFCRFAHLPFVKRSCMEVNQVIRRTISYVWLKSLIGIFKFKQAIKMNESLSSFFRRMHR